MASGGACGHRSRPPHTKMCKGPPCPEDDGLYELFFVFQVVFSIGCVLIFILAYCGFESSFALLVIFFLTIVFQV